MILDAETYKTYGYYSLNLKEKSHRQVIVRCEGCGETRTVMRKDYTDFCVSCSQKQRQGRDIGSVPVNPLDENTVYLIGDVHIGASTVDVDEIKALSKKYWSKNPIILMGDLCDLGLDRGMNWDNKYGPQQQLDIAEEIFKPLNVVAFTEGNHGNRIYEKVGLTPYNSIFELEPSDTYILNGREIFFTHGKSVAENYFLEHQKIVKWCGADGIFIGHSHDLGAMLFLRGNKYQWLVRTGSFLGRPRYVQRSAFAPKIRGWVSFNTVENRVRCHGLTEEGEVFIF